MAGGAGWDRGLAAFGLVAVAAFMVSIAGLLLAGGGQGHSMPQGGQHDASMQMDHGGHVPPTFTQSFALQGLIGLGVYLVGLALWAWRRGAWEMLARHVVVASGTLVLVVLFLASRGGLQFDVHNWNRAFADASVILVAATLAIGPLAKLWRPARFALAWRRETGIWGTLAAILHVGIFWQARYGWGGWQSFFSRTQTGDQLAFSLANAVGLVALVYAIVLTVTSNDASQRLLRKGWSWLMQRATTMQLLVLLHTWLFAYYITAQNPLATGTLWASFLLVLVLQTTAFAKTVWLRTRLPKSTELEQASTTLQA